MSETKLTIDFGGVTGNGYKEVIKDSDLLKVSDTLYNLNAETKRNLFKIGGLLNQVKTAGLYKKDGFKNITDYAACVCGYKSSFTYSLMTVAEKFVGQSGESSAYSMFCRPDGTDYTASQLVELKSLDSETVAALDKAGEINPGMSAKDLRQVAKAVTSGEMYIDGDGKVQEQEVKAEKEELSPEKVAAMFKQNLSKAQGFLNKALEFSAADPDGEMVGQIMHMLDILSCIMQELTPNDMTKDSLDMVPDDWQSVKGNTEAADTDKPKKTRTRKASARKSK